MSYGPLALAVVLSRARSRGRRREGVELIYATAATRPDAARPRTRRAGAAGRDLTPSRKKELRNPNWNYQHQHSVFISGDDASSSPEKSEPISGLFSTEPSRFICAAVTVGSRAPLRCGAAMKLIEGTAGLRPPI